MKKVPNAATSNTELPGKNDLMAGREMSQIEGFSKAIACKRNKV